MSNGNPVIYNSSSSWVWVENFVFRCLFPNSCTRADAAGYRFMVHAYGDMHGVDETLILVSCPRYDGRVTNYSYRSSIRHLS